jgi:plasmid stabilization system protein ParE
MTVSVTVVPRAANWARRETEYLRERRTEAGDKFVEMIDDALTLLSEHPRAGVAGLISDTRILVTGDYLISYRLRFGRDRETVQAVQIFAIRHRRQIDARKPS